MISFLMFLGIALSILRANGVIVVPTFCIVFCWVTSFFSWMVWSYAHGFTDAIKKAIAAKETEKGQKDE